MRDRETETVTNRETLAEREGETETQRETETERQRQRLRQRDRKIYFETLHAVITNYNAVHIGRLSAFTVPAPYH